MPTNRWKPEHGKHSADRRFHGKPMRPPLRTVTEIAERLGVCPGLLGRLLNESDAPKCQLDGKALGNQLAAKWYDPAQVVKWWRLRDYQSPERSEYQAAYYAKKKAERSAA